MIKNNKVRIDKVRIDKDLFLAVKITTVILCGLISICSFIVLAAYIVMLPITLGLIEPLNSSHHFPELAAKVVLILLIAPLVLLFLYLREVKK